MKGFIRNSILFALCILTGSIAARAQTGGIQPPVVIPEPPVVTVLASDPSASEDGPDSGAFQVSRTGDTTGDLTVYYSLGGTARNGRDYLMLPGWVTIKAGSATAEVTVTPQLDVDPVAETSESVVLQLHPLVDFPRGGIAPYALGWPSNAVVNIAESTTPPVNKPPTVKLVSPSDGAGFVTPVNIQIVAQARDADGTVNSVEFFAATGTETKSLGVVPNDLSVKPYKDLFTFVWNNPAAGQYVLTAKATDDKGDSTTSDPIKIGVLNDADVPVITVVATDPNASEKGPDTGTFTLTRTGDTTGPLAVYYSLDGTAHNGTDYQRLPGVVNFVAGSPTATVTVTPIPDLDPTAHDSDTVILQIRALSDIHPNVAGLYKVGTPDNATVTITEDPTAFPMVTVLATDPNAAEDGPDTGTFQVMRTGNSADPLTVFYSLGGTARNGRDYQMLPGSVTIPAGATTADITVTPILDVDKTPETSETVMLQLQRRVDPFPAIGGNSGMLYALGWPSNAVVTITESTKPPVNQPPVVRLVSPGDGTGFVAPASVQLVAEARDPDGTVASVEFFAETSKGKTSLGKVTDIISNGRYRGLYSFLWSNADVGNYALTAVATDDKGDSATSDPVHITITKTALPTVSIFAVDPIAFVGPSGTGTASFTVRRSDVGSSDLVVYYAIAGTASNGVDYDKLPGSITIPAGSKTASITINPLPDPNVQGPRAQTVILTLQAPAVVDDNPPTYLIGRPKQATAVIQDRSHRRFSSGWLDHGMFQVVVPVTQSPSMSYQLEVSTNLMDWETVGAADANQGSLQFVDPDAGNSANRFYRTVPVPDSN